LADEVLGTRILRFGEHTIDLGKPLASFYHHQALKELGGLDYATIRFGDSQGT
jgi:hypothetical protein